MDLKSGVNYMKIKNWRGWISLKKYSSLQIDSKPPHSLLKFRLLKIWYRDFDIFAKGLTEFQKLNYSFYSSIQKSMYLSSDIAKVIKDICKLFKVGVGQSSWGPTSYIFVNSKTLSLKIKKWKFIFIKFSNKLVYYFRY